MAKDNRKWDFMRRQIQADRDIIMGVIVEFTKQPEFVARLESNYENFPNIVISPQDRRERKREFIKREQAKAQAMLVGYHYLFYFRKIHQCPDTKGFYDDIVRQTTATHIQCL